MSLPASPLPAWIGVLIVLGNLATLAATAFLFRRAGAKAWPVALAGGAWFAIDLALAWTGSYEGFLVGRVPRILVGFGVPLTAALAAFTSERVRSVAARMDLRWLVGVQAYRVTGGVFLVAMAAGILPSAFAAPAGWGDILVGLTAPLVAVVVLRGRGDWWTAAAWNTVGLADLAMAFTLGNLGGVHTGNVLGAVPTTEALTQYPLVLIPTFMVPVSVFLHLSTYVRLDAERGRTGREASSTALDARTANEGEGGS